MASGNTCPATSKGIDHARHSLQDHRASRRHRGPAPGRAGALSAARACVVQALAPALWWGNLWPVLAAAGLAAVAWALWRLTAFRVRLPEGDILYFLSLPALRLRRGGEPGAGEAGWRFSPGRLDRARALLEDGERRLRRWEAAGMAGMGVIPWFFRLRRVS